MSRSHIIIVNYNAGDWLRRSVSSALKHSDGLVTVVDNASTDHSVVDTQSNVKDSRLRWVLNKKNLGFAAANNQVMQQAESEFLVLMNPDCELFSDTLDALFNVFDQNPKLGLASCRITNSDGTIQATCRRRFPTPSLALSRMLQLHRLFPNSPSFNNFDYGDAIYDTPPDINGSAPQFETVEAISGAFMVARSSAVNQVGFLDEGYFMHCEDLDWCKRFALAGWSVGFEPSVNVLHAKGVSSESRPVAVLWTLHKGMNRFFDKFYHSEYSWLTRSVVKVGILASFCARVLAAILKGLLKR